jgi:ABC-type multidrug transport system fused ATPase/permease subunit
MLKEVQPIALAGPMSFLLRFMRQGRNYSSLVGWYLYSIFRDPRRLIGAIVLSFLHLGSQGAAIGIIYWYGRNMQKDGPVTIPYLKISLNLKDQPELLWVIVIVSTTCFVLSASFLYLSRRALFDLLQQYFARKIENLVLLTLRLPDSRIPLASTLFMDFGVSGLAVGARRGALMAMGLAAAITALIGGIGASVFLFWVDAPLTFLILLSVVLAAFFLYPLTLRAVRTAKDREKAQYAFKVELRNIQEKQGSVAQLDLSMKSAGELARAFIMRRRVITEFVFAIEIGITIIVGLVVYYLASEALAGREQWAQFVAYIAALRMALNGIGQPIRSFGVVSRFYPNLVRYHLFMKDMQRLETLEFGRTKRGDAVILGTLPNGDDVVVEAGECLALLSTDTINEMKIALIGATVRGSRLPLETATFDSVNATSSDASIVIVKSSKLEKDGERLRTLLAGPLADKVTLISYERPEPAGSFGEKRVLTCFESELQRFAVLGSEESDAVLQEFALKIAHGRRRKGYVDADEEEDEV